MGKGSKRRPTSDQADPYWYDRTFNKKDKEGSHKTEKALKSKKVANNE
jgi:hypothetical protein